MRSTDDLLKRYRVIQTRVEERLPRLFDHLPKTGLRIVGEYPGEAGSLPLAWYSAPGTEGKRPGILHINMSREEEHTRERMETMFLREALPGRHLQTGLAREADSREGYHRFGNQPEYFDSWADYAACLGDRLGLNRFRSSDGGPILTMREAARKIVGSRFDLREFHRRVLFRGPVPLSLLERSLDRWARGQDLVKSSSHSSRRAVNFL